MAEKFLILWLRAKDRIPYTPPWIVRRRQKFDRLAQLNVRALTLSTLTLSEKLEQTQLKEFHCRYTNSYWRQMFL